MKKISCEDNGFFEETRKRAHAAMSKVTSDFSKERVDTKVEKYLKNKDKIRRPNTMQQCKGVDTTPVMMGKVLYSKVSRKKCLSIVQEELRLHQITFDEKESITNLVKN